MSHRMIYVSRCYRNLTSAGNKAKTDNEITMQEMGFVNVGLPQRINSNKVVTFFYDLAGVIKACLSFRRGDILVLQYPVKKYFSFLCDMAHWQGAKVIALVHDLGSMRRRKLTIRQEIRRLSHADCVIATNSVMEQWLKEQGLKVSTGALRLWDYRSGAPLPSVREKEHRMWKIAYAGSLAPRKNMFFTLMPQIIKDYELHIFGDAHAMPELAQSAAFTFHGFTPADDFITNNICDFGLVWDGDTLDACTGNFGGYLRYNTPHKASFYLRAGLPVIVWKEAAIAPTIEQEGAGLTISSLRDLPTKLAAISPNDYEAMRQKACAMARRLNNGYYFREAIDRALS